MRKTVYTTVIILFCLFNALNIQSQENIRPTSRTGDAFAYPFSHNTFIQPRYDRQNLKGGDYFDSYALRAVKTFNNYFHLRIDAPLASTNTSGENVFGLSDIKVRLAHTTSLQNQLYLGYGAELTLPTATDKSLGSEKWQARPELGLIYFLGNPDHIVGTAMLGVDYRFDYAGSSSRQHISVLGIAPNFDYWGNRWYIGYYATWTYDFNNHLWDIPLDIEAGYTILPKITLAAEYIQPLLKKRTYNNEYAIKLKYAF